MSFWFISYVAPTVRPNQGSAFPYFFQFLQEVCEGSRAEGYIQGKAPWNQAKWERPAHRHAASATQCRARRGHTKKPDPGWVVLGDTCLRHQLNFPNMGSEETALNQR